MLDPVAAAGNWYNLADQDRWQCCARGAGGLGFVCGSAYGFVLVVANRSEKIGRRGRRLSGRAPERLLLSLAAAKGMLELLQWQNVWGRKMQQMYLAKLERGKEKAPRPGIEPGSFA